MDSRMMSKSLCGCGDTCEDVICKPRCYGYDWEMICINGECEKGHIIERDSKECGYISNESISCPSKCDRVDLWAMKVIEGECARDHIIKEGSEKKHEELRRKLDEDYVEDRISKEEYLKKKKKLEEL